MTLPRRAGTIMNMKGNKLKIFNYLHTFVFYSVKTNMFKITQLSILELTIIYNTNYIYTKTNKMSKNKSSAFVTYAWNNNLHRYYSYHDS